MAIQQLLEQTATQLTDCIAHKTCSYADVRQAIDDAPKGYDDDLALAFVKQQPDLDRFAATRDGRAMLDVLYDALITGSVHDVEREQADRILKAKRNYLQPGQYRGEIFPISDPIFGENAVFVAELENGKVHLHYMTRGLYRDRTFKEEAKTLPYDLDSHDLVLEPDDVVRVKLYDQGEITVTVQAIQLIDFSNQGLEKFEGRVETTVMLALTLPAGAGALGGSSVRALAAAVEAGEASKVALAVETLILWADRAAFVIQLTSLVVNANRDWILKKFPTYGGAFLAALDQVDGFVNMYGWGRMGLDGFRLIRHKITPALKDWRREAAARKQLTAAEQATVKGIGDQLDNFVDRLAPGEAVASINEHPSEHPIEGNKPGERRAPVKDGHEVVEVHDAKGIHCEYHSPDDPIVACPHGMGASAPAKAEPAPPKTNEPPPKEKAGQPAAAHPDEPVKKPPPGDVGTAHAPPLDPKRVEHLKQKLTENEKRIAEIDRQSQIHEQRRQEYLDKAKSLEGQNLRERAQTAAKHAGNERELRDKDSVERSHLTSENQSISNELNPPKTPKPGPPPGKPHGGAYKDMEAWGGERHHIPPDDTTSKNMSRGKGPAIWMERNDHLQLNSTGNRKLKPTQKYPYSSSEDWRAAQKDLIRKARFRKRCKWRSMISGLSLETNTTRAFRRCWTMSKR